MNQNKIAIAALIILGIMIGTGAVFMNRGYRVSEKMTIYNIHDTSENYQYLQNVGDTVARN